MNKNARRLASAGIAIGGLISCAACEPAEPASAPPPPVAAPPPPPPPAAPGPSATAAPSAAPVAAAPPAVPADPCAIPSTPAATPEETIWRVFVAVNCPTSNPTAPLKWETWTEQTCFEKPNAPGCGLTAASAAGAATRHLHGSRLRRRKPTLTAAELQNDCTAMTTASPKDPLTPFVPKNLAPNPKFCEEVFVNAPEVAYVRAPSADASLVTLTKQQLFTTNATIQFPTDAVELKADWLPATSLVAGKGFDCKNPPPGLHVEVIGGACYALVGLHVSSKLLPNWLWGTFEPQSDVTNPNRCNPELYSNCNDPWGSDPAASTGSPTAQTPSLAALMASAHLLPEFANYRLVIAQTAYATPTLAGNSFIEFNADVPPKQASCITCHGYAVFSAKTPPGSKTPENPNFGAFPGSPAVGDPVFPPPPTGGVAWVHQDFSWMLGIMPVK